MSKWETKAKSVGGWSFHPRAFIICHSICSMCFGPNWPLESEANVLTLIVFSECILIEMLRVVSEAKRAMFPLHWLPRVAKYRSKRSREMATTSLGRSKWSTTL